MARISLGIPKTQCYSTSEHTGKCEKSTKITNMKLRLHAHFRLELNFYHIWDCGWPFSVTMAKAVSKWPCCHHGDCEPGQAVAPSQLTLHAETTGLDLPSAHCLWTTQIMFVVAFASSPWEVLWRNGTNFRVNLVLLSKAAQITHKIDCYLDFHKAMMFQTQKMS